MKSQFLRQPRLTSLIILFSICISFSASASPVDFDGDGKTDPTVYRPVTGMWYMRPSSGFCPAGWTTIGTYQCQRQWGLPGDVPLVGDFDQDGKGDVTVYRQSNFHFYTNYSSAPFSVAYQFPDGTGGLFPSTADIPSVGDVNGDGRSDIVIYQPTGYYNRAIARVYVPSIPAIVQYSNLIGLDSGIVTPVKALTADYLGQFSNPSGSAYGDEVGHGYAFTLGFTGVFRMIYRDVKTSLGQLNVTRILTTTTFNSISPVKGNFTGTAPIQVAEPAYFDGASGEWHVRSLATNNWNPPTNWGLPNDIPVPGDYTGDGKTEYAVWRPASGEWFIKMTGVCPIYASTYSWGGCYVQWGLPGDIPVTR